MNRYAIYNMKTQKFLTTSRGAAAIFEEYWGEFSKAALFHQKKNAEKALKDSKRQAEEYIESKDEHFIPASKKFRHTLRAILVVEIVLVPKLPLP